MNIEEVRDYCIGKKAAEECFPFGDDTLVFKVMGKMFACISVDDPTWLDLKCEPEYALELRERYQGIEGAFHFNKKYWNQVRIEGDVPDSLIRRLIDHSYEEVLKKFTRKMREAYEQL